MIGGNHRTPHFLIYFDTKANSLFVEVYDFRGCLLERRVFIENKWQSLGNFLAQTMETAVR